MATTDQQPPSPHDSPPPAPASRSQHRHVLLRIAGIIGALLLLLLVVLYFLPITYAYVPPRDRVLNPTRINTGQGADLWGRSFSRTETKKLRQTSAGLQLLSPANGAVLIDSQTLDLGRRAFYAETFGNEVLLTDITGLVDGPFTFWGVARAVLAARDEGTTNLQVRLASDATVGDRHFSRGEIIDTGLDVPKGAWAPLGMVVKKQRGTIRVGISCAACHSTVDPVSRLVVEGAPNADGRTGLLLALAPNSASFFVHGDVTSMTAFQNDPARTALLADGRTTTLPDPAALEKAVDEVFLRWPPGTFDSMVDLKADPTQTPDSFTFQDFPYGWTGFAAIGPFHGLSSLNNNVHALNSDPLTNAAQSLPLFGIETETYYAIVLQNASRFPFRFQPGSAQKPSRFFQSVDPTPRAPAANELLPLPTFPKGSLAAPDGLWISREGLRVWEQVNAMAAWQNTLSPPPPPAGKDRKAAARGRAVFEKAQCGICHSGPAFTNHRVIPVAEVGTEPVRAQALKRTESLLDPPVVYTFENPVPLPGHPRTTTMPVEVDPEQIKLAYAHGNSPGGYKVPGLIGLRWTAPYLHDSGVAVGPDASTQLGVSGTLYRSILPDPANSLRALLDRDLRSRVIEANENSEPARRTNTRGTGHEFWIDAPGGFSPRDQDDLIEYLLDLRPSSGNGKTTR